MKHPTNQNPLKQNDENRGLRVITVNMSFRVTPNYKETCSKQDETSRCFKLQQNMTLHRVHSDPNYAQPLTGGMNKLPDKSFDQRQQLY